MTASKVMFLVGDEPPRDTVWTVFLTPLASLLSYLQMRCLVPLLGVGILALVGVFIAYQSALHSAVGDHQNRHLLDDWMDAPQNNNNNNNNIGSAPQDTTIHHDRIVDESPKQNNDDSNKSDNDRPLNILLLYGDDWTLKTLGVLNKVVLTPNLDKLAQNGMLFTHNCVTTSICMISRATLYTGQYASRHETYLPSDSAMYRDGVWNQTLWPLLQQHGYHTGMVGKWHHPPPPATPKAFDTFLSYQSSHYRTRGNTTKHITAWNEQDALEFLEARPRQQPFALMVSFFAIHAEDFGVEQYRPQTRSRHLYNHTVVPTPPTATRQHFEDLPYFFRNGRNFGRGRWQKRYSTPALYQKMMKVRVIHYYCRKSGMELVQLVAS